MSLAAPDGFALHAPGRVGQLGAAEPQTDQRRPEWAGAQAGFRVYRELAGHHQRLPQHAWPAGIRHLQ
ncbi:MAG: hypothetical protein V9H69_02470 [Anaerolineae bacterium]